MKKLLLLFVAILVTVTAAESAQRKSPPFACGTITYRDGHEETYDHIGIVAMWTQDIIVQIGDNKKNQISIPASDIHSITYWSKDTPEEKTTIFCLSVTDERKKYHGELICEWGMPIMGNQWGVIFRCYDFYRLDPKTGKLHMVVYIINARSITSLVKPDLEDWQPLLLQRFDMDHAVFIGNIRNYTDRKTKEKIAEYSWPAEKVKKGAENFKDNPEVYQQILDGTLKASDLQYIIDQMYMFYKGCSKNSSLGK